MVGWVFSQNRRLVSLDKLARHSSGLAAAQFYAGEAHCRSQQSYAIAGANHLEFAMHGEFSVPAGNPSARDDFITLDGGLQIVEFTVNDCHRPIKRLIAV